MYLRFPCLRDSSASYAPIEYRCIIRPMAEQENPVTKTDLEALETRLVERLEKTETALETRLLERIEKTETTLLLEFRKWALSFESRFRANEILVGGFNERILSKSVSAVSNSVAKLTLPYPEHDTFI